MLKKQWSTFQGAEHSWQEMVLPHSLQPTNCRQRRISELDLARGICYMTYFYIYDFQGFNINIYDGILTLWSSIRSSSSPHNIVPYRTAHFRCATTRRWQEHVTSLWILKAIQQEHGAILWNYMLKLQKSIDVCSWEYNTSHDALPVTRVSLLQHLYLFFQWTFHER